MIKIDIVKRVADKLQLKDKEALAVVDTIVESLKESLREHGRMEIRNFGVFQIKQRKPRTGRNPRNKKEYPIFPRRVVTFKLGKELKDFAVREPDETPAPRMAEPPTPKAPAPSSDAPPSAARVRNDVEQPSLFGNDDLT